MSQRANQKYAEEASADLGFAVDLVSGLKLKPASAEEGGAVIPVQRFDKAVLFGSETLYEICSEDDIWNTAEVFDLWPVHSKVMSISVAAGDHLAVLRSLDTVTVKQTRGRIRRPFPKMLRFSSAHIYEGGIGRTSEYYYGVKNDGALENISNVNGQVIADELAVQQVLAQLMAGLSLYMHYSWSVHIQSVGSDLAVRVPTSAEGARKLLTLRDVEPGYRRRKALRHWVTAHVRRRTAEDAAKDVAVRAHLRGATPFRWEDFEGSVQPSNFDLERNGATT